MKIKAIREFRNLSLVEQREKLQRAKKILNLCKVAQGALGTLTILEAAVLLKDTPSNLINVWFGCLGAFYGFCGSTYAKNTFYKDVIQQETIINLEEDELTR